MRKVAVTGALCSGKSAVCDFLEKQGAYLVSADEIVHRLLSSNSDCIKQVIKLLGPEVTSHQKIDRKKVADRVFSDEKLLFALEKIVHPLVLREIQQEYKLAKETPHKKVFVAEVPLLFETKWEIYFDHTVYVDTDYEERLTRYTHSGGNESEYKKRMKRQMDPAEKREKAEFCLPNRGSLSQLKEEVLRIAALLKS